MYIKLHKQLAVNNAYTLVYNYKTMSTCLQKVNTYNRFITSSTPLSLYYLISNEFHCLSYLFYTQNAFFRQKCITEVIFSYTAVLHHTYCVVNVVSCA